MPSRSVRRLVLLASRSVPGFLFLVAGGKRLVRAGWTSWKGRGPIGTSGARPSTIADSSFVWIYLAIAGAMAVLAAIQLSSPLRLGSPGADIWQHLAALNAIIEDPAHPTNPFVPTEDSSRLFGPYWLAIGLVAKAAGSSALQIFIFAGILNVLLWLAAVFVFGRAYLGSSRGAVFLLLSLTLAWILPPSFTGYHSPIAVITGAAYPAFFLLALTLFQWAQSIRYLDQGRRGPAIVILTAVALATHPFGALIAIAGSASFAIFASDSPPHRRLQLGLLLLGGSLLALLWPYYSVVSVLVSASSPGWTTSANFYSGAWLFQSLMPAAFGIGGLLGRRARPLAALLLLCILGFGAGASPHLAPAHRLLPYMALILHIGLASIIVSGWENRTLRWFVLSLALMITVVQLRWTATIIVKLRQDLARNGSLLDAAALLTSPLGPRSVIAGHAMASWPVAATGRRVLSTPFPEPMIPDLRQRQAVSKALFEPALTQKKRAELMADYCVTHLIADTRMLPETYAAILRREAIGVQWAGNLILFELAARTRLEESQCVGESIRARSVLPSLEASPSRSAPRP